MNIPTRPPNIAPFPTAAVPPIPWLELEVTLFAAALCEPVDAVVV